MAVVHLLRMLIPGVGQVWQDRHLSGLIYFFMFIFLINGIIVGPDVLSTADHDTLRAACAGLAGLVWLISAYDYLRYEGVRRQQKTAPKDSSSPP